MADESKKYLDYEGLAHLVEKIDGKIASASSGTSGHTGACDGVFVAYVDYEGVRRICAASGWSSSLGAAQGVMVGDGSHELLLAPTRTSSTMCWNNGSLETIGGAITTSSSTTAKTDFNGRLDTAAIVNMGGDYASADYASGFCHQYAYGVVGAGDWWLPSCGELYLIYSNKDGIDDALSAIGANALDGTYWSSTQSDPGYAWYMSMNYGNFNDSDTFLDYYVRAVAAFDYEL